MTSTTTPALTKVDRSWRADTSRGSPPESQMRPDAVGEAPVPASGFLWTPMKTPNVQVKA
ncbi:hypothetical protein [Mycobacterium sp. IS-1590]|uniref:hypothetical protein n=1 Tax=Mycobacterium sp. IS-1590 TaxID=1772286 RepID=UPI001E36C2D4|nr:hypothetical protein [Mycobacterium sp. IS-1590]